MARTAIYMDTILVISVLRTICNTLVSDSAFVAYGLKATNCSTLTTLFYENTEVMNTNKDKDMDRLHNITDTEPTLYQQHPVTSQRTTPNVLTRQNTADKLNASRVRSENATLTVSGLAACLKNPIVRKFTVNGSAGYFHANSQSQTPGPPGPLILHCWFTLHVQHDQGVRFRVGECTGNVELRYSDYFSAINRDSVRAVCKKLLSWPILHSMSNTVTVIIYYKSIGRKSMSLSFSFSAVNRSERQHVELQRISVSPSTWYLQTPGLDGITPCAVEMRSCVTLTRPKDHIIFLTTITWKNNKHVFTFLGRCGSRQNIFKQLQKYVTPIFLFPDDFGNGTSAEHHLSLFVSNSFYYWGCARLKFRFSFYTESLKPRRVSGLSTWNCSVSMWPDLAEHFPCDMVFQCAEHEDEARCSYTSDRCGPDKIDVGGTCYIFRKTDGKISRVEAQKECQTNGASLVSLETAKEMDAFTELLTHVGFRTKTWIGLKKTGMGREKILTNTMYIDTLSWESGAVAFFLPRISWDADIDFKCVYWTSQSNRLVLSYCDKQKDGFICELPSVSDRHLINTPVTLPVPSSTTASSIPLELCPMQHLTHTLLACDVKSWCRGLENTETWYRAICSMSHGPSQPYFYCDIAEDFVPYTLVCDFREDCLDGSDEDFCEHPACKEDMLDCGNRQCVDRKKHCDGFKDCETNHDETNCFFEGYLYGEIRPPAVVNFNINGGFTVTPLPENSWQCPDTHFQCHNDGYCLPVYTRCNDMIDCPDHEDEANCENYKTCPGHYRCRDQQKTVCVHVNHLCDGQPQCPLHDDELTCNVTCSQSCVCYGFSFFCNSTDLINTFSQIRYLEVSSSGVYMSAFSHNIMLIHLGVQACGLKNLTRLLLPNLHSVDLSRNLLHSASFSHFSGMPQLRLLNLAENPLSDRITHIPRKPLHQSLLIFNISHVQTSSINMSALSALMPNLQVLDLSWNKIKVLQEQEIFPNIQFLNLQGCPISDFTPNVMKRMSNLMYVFADSFKLCCSAVLPDNFGGKCLAPFDEISSCDDLLKSIAYRCALVVFAVIAVLGNLSCFVYRLHFLQKGTTTGFVIFVLHLCASDFLMGTYLVFIGVADWIYAGSYIWNETLWKNSSACSIAGFLSLVSSEVSAFMICSITLDRFLVLRFPFSQIRFTVRSAQVACVIMWMLGLTLAMVPLLPVTLHWGFFHQTGICVPLPVTRTDFPGHVYSFSVMIICNLILFLMIGMGQLLIYWSVRKNTISSQLIKAKHEGNQKAQTKEATIARRLFSVAVSDFLCWFPIGLCGVLAANGVVIPGEVNVGMAIFVMPLNSALNPFLYTLNVVMEKRRKAQELRFLKLLNTQQKM